MSCYHRRTSGWGVTLPESPSDWIDKKAISCCFGALPWQHVLCGGRHGSSGASPVRIHCLHLEYKRLCYKYGTAGSFFPPQIKTKIAICVHITQLHEIVSFLAFKMYPPQHLDLPLTASPEHWEQLHISSKSPQTKQTPGSMVAKGRSWRAFVKYIFY